MFYKNRIEALESKANARFNDATELRNYYATCNRRINELVGNIELLTQKIFSTNDAVEDLYLKLAKLEPKKKAK